MSDDIFDAVELLESDLTQLGEVQGTKEGKKRQYKDGYAKGWQQACHTLHEIGSLYASLVIISQNIKQIPESSNDSTGNQSGIPTQLTPRLQCSLNKILHELSNEEKWLKLGLVSEDELASHLSSIQTRAKFLLNKLNISTHFEDKTVDADF